MPTLHCLTVNFHLWGLYYIALVFSWNKVKSELQSLRGLLLDLILHSYFNLHILFHSVALHLPILLKVSRTPKSAILSENWRKIQTRPTTWSVRRASSCLDKVAFLIASRQRAQLEGRAQISGAPREFLLGRDKLHLCANQERGMGDYGVWGKVQCLLFGGSKL